LWMMVLELWLWLGVLMMICVPLVKAMIVSLRLDSLLEVHEWL
jgi:hypothetical protein